MSEAALRAAFPCKDHAKFETRISRKIRDLFEQVPTSWQQLTPTKTAIERSFLFVRIS
jgi:hypothetical protein